jgi:hypothetical protein
VTTADHYFARYQLLLDGMARLSPDELLARWRSAPITAAFVAEHRTGVRFRFSRPDLDVEGLSDFRTRLAQSMTERDRTVLCGGKGWADVPLRQSLPDWHLDKLAQFGGQVRLMSALENTHCSNYITEKVFDAFGVGGIPIYFASPTQGIERLVPPESILNVWGMTLDEATEALVEFWPDSTFVDAYRAGINSLRTLFSRPDRLIGERERVLKALIARLEDCAGIELAVDRPRRGVMAEA